MRTATVIVCASLSLAILLPSFGPVLAAEGQDDSTYQIVKATENRVWRLNKVTGEIAVCTLDGDRMICTSSTKAVVPPKISYEERNAERTKADADAAAKAERDREIAKAKDLEFLDRVIAAFRILIGAAIEHQN